MTENKVDQNKYKISFNGKQYLAEEFTTKEQMQQFINGLKLPDTLPFNIGRVVDPKQELFKYEKNLGEALLQELIQSLTENSRGRANIDEATARQVGKLILTKVLPEIRVETLVEEIVRKVASFKVGDNITLTQQ